MATKNIAKKDVASEEAIAPEVSKKESKSHKKVQKDVKKPQKKEKMSKTMKIIFFSMIGVLVVLGIIMLIMSMNSGDKSVSGNAAAVVNGEKILSSDLDALYNRLPVTTKAQVTKTELLDQMINEKILMQEAKNKGFNVTQSEINDFLDKLLLQSGISKQEFLSRLESQNITEKVVNDEIYKQLIITKLYQSEIIEKVNVTDTDILDYYNKNIDGFRSPEKVQASHILICSKESMSCESNLTKEEALAKINEIKAKATPSNFADLAKQYSQDGSAAQGGDLGYFEKGVMVAPFEDAAFKTPVGQISNVVETQYGFHIILVVDKKPEQTIALDDVSEEIKQLVLSQKQQDVFKSYLENVKAKSNIEINFKE